MGFFQVLFHLHIAFSGKQHICFGLGDYVLFGLLLHCRCEVGFFGSIFSGMELFDISAHDEITEHEKRP